MIKINIPLAAKAFFARMQDKSQDEGSSKSKIIAQEKRDILLLASSEEAAQNLWKQSLFLNKNALRDNAVHYLPSFDNIPYDISSPCPNILATRAKTLTNLALGLTAPKILVTSAINLITKLPPKEIFLNNILNIQSDLQITIDTLSKFLSQNGFLRVSSAIDSGEFAVKGEIIDIVISAVEAYRVVLKWNRIESIKQYDPISQLSIRDVEKIVITPASELIINQDTIISFKNNFLKNFGIGRTNISLFTAIMEQRKYPGCEQLTPLFYDQLISIIDYLNNPIIIYDNFALQSILEYQTSFNDFYDARAGANKLYHDNFYPLLDPSLFIFDIHQTNTLLAKEGNILITKEVESSNLYQHYNSDNLHDIISQHKTTHIIIIFYNSRHGLEAIKTLLSNDHYTHVVISDIAAAKIGVVNLVGNIKLDSSFITDKYLFITGRDILPDKDIVRKTLSSQKRLKNILAELESLTENELVVHKEHGIGRFLGLETIEARGILHDCVKILYAENAKLYVPVENIDCIKKYGQFEVELDRLGSVSWQKRKGKLKNRISEIAHKLLATTAKRKNTNMEPINYDLAQYEAFCAKFPYVETDDQLKAIADIKEDFASGIIMDRLICGDVGFGKTEVALRAAYMVATDCKIHDAISQVAVIVPTTILCKQHYKRFCERFAGFDLKIGQVSRLVSTREIRKIKEEIKNGDIDIIIGTHAILGKDLEFKNLRLLIIDEEQHFGVTQKEKLKELKPQVHVLSLSATPIPRTLQMSMVGLKDLSLIAEAPIDRLAIRTNIMPFDGVIIKDALLKEHARGGKSFYVVPRISDITDVEKKLNNLVPELKYKIAHGGMSPVVVDETMQEFDDGKFDILVSTSIIESGIDIPSANTMVIHKSDQFGLAQSYQLRGRVGRGKIRGYVYFTLENKRTTKNAMNRLEILQTIDNLGAGFTIASHDMDHRGFGNLVGEEQSGHIKEVGVELYQDMLDEQISLLSNHKEENQKEERTSPNINLGLAVFISQDYIADSALRLGIYRRIGNLSDNDEIESFKEEMIDRFGKLPQEFSNLLEIVKIKLICKDLNIISLDAAEKGFVIKFYADANVHDLVLKFIKRFPTQAKIKPDNKLIFIQNLDKMKILSETTLLLDQLKIRLPA